MIYANRKLPGMIEELEGLGALNGASAAPYGVRESAP